MAKVATGMPAGICTIDNRLSTPRNTRLSTGTPSTGSGVSAAAMPGRSAAPPAPAMMILRPRAWAVRAYSKSRSGVGCRAGQITRGKLRDNVRQQLALYLRDLVLQHQLALLQPLHLQLIERAA